MNRRRNNEKAKDLIGTWVKLGGRMRKYAAAIALALICAIVGTVLTLIGPDRLSELTDEVTAGIQPNTEVLTEISEEMQDNISANMEDVSAAIQENLAAVGTELAAQQMAAQADSMESVGMEEDNTEAAAQMMTMLTSLSDEQADAMIPEIEVNGSVIDGSDQIAAVTAMSSMSESFSAESDDSDAVAEDTEDSESGNTVSTATSMDTSAMLELLDELPDSLTNAIFTDITVEGTVISGQDQLDMIEVMADMDQDDTEAMLAAFDSLPDSVYDLVKPSVNMDRVMAIGISLVIMYALSWLFSAVQGWTMATVTQRITKKMRTDISQKINRLPMWYYNTTSTGDVLSRVTNDVDTISQSLNQSIGTLVSASVLLVGSLIMMLKTNGWMTLTAVVASLIGFVLMFTIMGRSQKYFLQQQKSLGNLNGHIEEMYSGHTVVRAYNGEEASGKTFDEMNEELRMNGFKAQSLAGLMQPLMGFVGNLGYVAVCVVGGAMALDGRISFGVIVAFIMYVRYFTQPLSQIAQGMQSMQSAAAAGERVFEFLEAEEMEDESGKTEKLENVQGTVEFSHVKFGYEDSDATIIHDFSAKAKPGQKIAIVGPTGAGKTTMVNLLMRFHEIQEGEIRIDGTSTKDVTRENVHEQFCMVLQDTWLFEGTVRENLVYCEDGVSDEKIRQACKAVGLDHFIRTLPNGYDTVLNDQVNLSAGQKQQLTIARAMIADRPMLILDEATSSVDTRTEQKIQQAMDQLMENRTSFVIAHRLSTIKNSDLILVLKDGDIIESGTHEELLAKNGFYADLYNSQFEDQIAS